MFTFLRDAHDITRGGPPTPFMAFFAYVWLVWVLKALAARRYRPFTDDPGPLAVTVLAFATMLHQSWSTRGAALPYEVRHEAALAESAHL